jgi:hypothetical protein
MSSPHGRQPYLPDPPVSGLQAERAGLGMSVRELLRQLAGIGETVLIYPAGRGRRKTRRMLTEITATQDKLIEVFQLGRYAPAVSGY